MARRDCRHDCGSAGECGDRVAHRDRGLGGALSALAPDKGNNRERDGERRPNRPGENIERGLSAHDAPHCIAEQRLRSVETLCAWRDFVVARIDARSFDAPCEVMRFARNRRRLKLRRSLFTRPLRGRVGSRGEQRNVRRGGVTVSPLGHCWTWRDRHPTPSRIVRCVPTRPLKGRVRRPPASDLNATAKPTAARSPRPSSSGSPAPYAPSPHPSAHRRG
jgi:hypothetical protein